MDKFEIRGKNIVNNVGFIHKIEYFYEIEFEEKWNRLYFEVLKYETNSPDIFVNKVNLLLLAGKIVFDLDNNKRIKSVENYDKIKKKITMDLYMLEIRNPDLKDILEYIEEKIEKEENFINFIMEMDFLEFLFGGNQEKKTIEEFYGIDRKINFEVCVEQKIKNNKEEIIYSIEKSSLNKALIKYIMNNEEKPEYYLEGKGEKKYKEGKLLNAKLEIKSGKKGDLEREVYIEIKKVER